MNANIRLQEKFQYLRENGLQDLKIQYIGPVGVSDGSVDALSAEVLAILEAYENGHFIDNEDKFK